MISCHFGLRLHSNCKTARFPDPFSSLAPDIYVNACLPAVSTEHPQTAGPYALRLAAKPSSDGERRLFNYRRKLQVYKRHSVSRAIVVSSNSNFEPRGRAGVGNLLLLLPLPSSSSRVRVLSICGIPNLVKSMSAVGTTVLVSEVITERSD